MVELALTPLLAGALLLKWFAAAIVRGLRALHDRCCGRRAWWRQRQVAAAQRAHVLAGGSARPPAAAASGVAARARLARTQGEAREISVR